MATSLINDRILEEALKNIKAYIDTNHEASKNITTELNELMSQIDNLDEEIHNITLESLGGIEEAPYDEYHYVRQNKRWVKVEDLNFNNGTPSKPDGPNDPNSPDDPDAPKEEDFTIEITTNGGGPLDPFPASGGSTSVKTKVLYRGTELPTDGFTYIQDGVTFNSSQGAAFGNATWDSYTVGANTTNATRSENWYWNVKINGFYKDGRTLDLQQSHMFWQEGAN